VSGVHPLRGEHLPEAGLTATDAELLRRSAGGDASAFEQFVRRHEAAAMRLLLASATTPADAEDALQEAFLAAWRAAGAFAGTGSARAWILTIARNALHRRYRRRAGEPADLISLDRLGAEAGWGAVDAPDQLVERLEDREILERALARLEQADREVLVLRDLEELGGEETARLLGVSVGAMKSRLHRARLRLAAQLREGWHARA